jgi:broad specificity phosphatase PhoE
VSSLCRARGWRLSTQEPQSQAAIGAAAFTVLVTKIYFVRHGESVANAGGVTMEHALIPLSSLGRAQAEAIATVLAIQPSRVLVSKFVRARETAQPFCARAGAQAEVHPLLHEFSALDPATIECMTGEQRRPIANAYWQAADPSARMGSAAETFLEFDARVADFLQELATLPDGCVLFGHGIWLGLLCWKLLGFTASDEQGMRAFRKFQTGLPLPNGAIYVIESCGPESWRFSGDEIAMRKIAAVRPPPADGEQRSGIGRMN